MEPGKNQAERPRNEDKVSPLANDLIGDVNIAAARVVRLRNIHPLSLARQTAPCPSTTTTPLRPYAFASRCRVWAATSRVLRPANPFAAEKASGLVGRDPLRLEHETSVPTGDRAVEPRRIKLGEEQAERERIPERELADLARGDLGLQEIAIRSHV
jgi:hypothetical protein